jgi:hypothetical protein
MTLAVAASDDVTGDGLTDIEHVGNVGAASIFPTGDSWSGSVSALSCRLYYRDRKSSTCLSHRMGHPIKPAGFDAVARAMGRSREDPVNDPPLVTSGDILRWLAGAARMKALTFARWPGVCRNNAAR